MSQKSSRKERSKRILWRGRELDVNLEELLGFVDHAIELGLPKGEGVAVKIGLKGLYL